MIMCVLLCYPVSIRIYYQQGVLFLVKIDCILQGIFLFSLMAIFGFIWDNYLVQPLR